MSRILELHVKLDLDSGNVEVRGPVGAVALAKGALMEAIRVIDQHANARQATAPVGTIVVPELVLSPGGPNGQ